MQGIDDAVLVALVRGLGKPAPVAPGDYAIDQTVTLHVQGNLRKGEPTEYTPTISIPLKATLALLLARMGFQRDRVKELLVGAMTEAINLDEKGEDHISALLADVDAAMTHVQQVTAALPKATREGATTGNVRVAVVQPEPQAA